MGVEIVVVFITQWVECLFVLAKFRCSIFRVDILYLFFILLLLWLSSLRFIITLASSSCTRTSCQEFLFLSGLSLIPCIGIDLSLSHTVIINIIMSVVTIEVIWSFLLTLLMMGVSRCCSFMSIMMFATATNWLFIMINYIMSRWFSSSSNWFLFMLWIFIFLLIVCITFEVINVVIVFFSMTWSLNFWFLWFSL